MMKMLLKKKKKLRRSEKGTEEFIHQRRKTRKGRFQ